MLSDPQLSHVTWRALLGKAWLRVALLMALLLSGPQAVLAQTGGSGFDHSATAFVLSGKHEDVRCDACHLRGIFKGTPKECAGCHVQNNPRGALAMPTLHLQTTQACDACHSPAGFANTHFSHFSVSPGNCASCHDSIRAPGKTATHVPTSASCDQCHNTQSFSQVLVKPDNHIPYQASAACSDCHRNPNFAVVPPLANIHANAPSGSACADCHGAAAASFAIPSAGFAVMGKPGNHLPTSAPCEQCHAGPGTGVGSLPVGNGARFSGGLMVHAGISSGCATCHQPAGSAASFAGITAIVGMPPTSPMGPNAHIPSGTTCESCHLASMPGGAVPASATRSAPGTGFGSPAPTGAQIHSGITSGCSNCHESQSVWMGMGAYPISPSALTAGALYNGFQTRPRSAAGTFNVADPAHPVSGDCSQCHGNTTAFSGIDRPANHIPFAATAQCNSCHTGSDYSVMPTVANIHANAPSSSTNCGQCHGAAAASFAIPAVNFAIVGLPSNHLPSSASCEVCHVGPGSSMSALPVVDGARFSGSLYNHAGVTSNCVSCHLPKGSNVDFAGLSGADIVHMPATSPAGPDAHIPSSTVCESCHLASLPAGLIPTRAVRAAPGTGFATPAPTGAQIHSGITAGCDTCHEANLVWMGVSAYPISPGVLTSGASYRGFQTRPRSLAGTYNVADPAHPGSGDCAACHIGTTAFVGAVMPANHIPVATTATCNACHTGGDYATVPSLANIHANAPSTTGNCAQCHGSAAASFAIPASNFAIVGLPANHLPTTASCETCHVGSGSSVATLPVGNGAKFSGSLMSHVGISSNCVACHVPSGTSSAFAGIARVVGMPPTSPATTGSHIPSSTACESCHLGSMPASPVAASATKTAPGTAFAAPAPTGAMIHAGVTGGCATCHEGGLVWMGMGAYPISPSTLTSGAVYNGFQTRPRAAAGPYNVADPAHPLSGDCSQCHGNTTAFSGIDKPANHIPFAATAQCNSCHTGTDYSAMPTLSNIHANAPSTTSNCAQCHGAAAASFALPAANFAIVGLPANHIPTSASCEVCHVGAGSSVAALPVGNGARFAGSLMSHAGIASNCAACHQPAGTASSFAGIARIVGMPATSPAGASSHIPSSNTCETCHLASTPAGLVPATATATAPGTAFASPAPTGTQIHTGISSGCATCHEANLVWMGMGAYPISPSALVAGAQYKGFQTRPRTAAGTYNVADSAHPTGGECSQCHANTTAFTGVDKPGNHIPVASTAQCNSCHTSTDYAVIPTMANIHANAPSTTTNCAQCHGAAAASFAIPAANFAIVGLPSNHIPTSASCEVCHVAGGSSVASLPVGNGARFSGSLMSHAGISGNCVTCHVPSGAAAAFAGISTIVGMPPTSPAGAGSHIPSSTACESCHLASMPSGLVTASATRAAPGTAFATPAPTSSQIHGSITSGCNTCHETGLVWMGVSAYPITPATVSPGAQFHGFQTRPTAAGSTYSVADGQHPSSRDCSECHSSTAYFIGPDKPANHIPYAATAVCDNCHTSSDYSITPTLANIHAYAPSSTTNCAQCHGAAAASFALPAHNFAIVGLPSNHLPTAASCEVCHVGPGSSIAALPVANGARFAASLMNHSGITANCVSCHVPAGSSAAFAGIGRIVGMPPTSPMGPSAHIPSSTACESCHLASTPSGSIAASATLTAPGTAFASPAPTGTMIHNGVTSGCNTCHDSSAVWMGVSAYPITPSALTTGAQYKGFQTRPRSAAGTYNVADPAHPASGDCSLCHGNTTAFTGIDKPANHIPYAATAQCNNCHTSTDYAALPTLANIHAYAPSTTGNCAQCHGATAASFAIPSANFAIVGLPTNHIPTSESCEVCHVGTGSSVATVPVGNGARFSGSLMSHLRITGNCVACHQPAGSASSFAGITAIIGMPATSPAGAGAHIPSSTACEACHLATTPTAMVAASASRTAPGTAFATPAPTGVQIHAGISGGCSNCHDTNQVWMGMGAYPISPSTLTAGAQYKGFQTRPVAGAATYRVADASHPVSGECSLCHTSTTAFVGVNVPANHIPYAATAGCTACHTDPNYATMPTVANIHANAQSTTTNCAQCHSAAAVAQYAIPAANFSIVGIPTNGTHIPTTASCEVCHVGTGSSVATLPVGNGAHFSGSLMSHAGITTNCVSCHLTSGSVAAPYTGITRIVGMPATSPMGVNAHIPSTSVCENCHATSSVSGLIAASATRTAPGTLFATPAATGAQIHTGITSGCSACHDTGMVWMGVSAYPITPAVITSGAQYKGFQTRPQSVAGTYNVLDSGHPTTGDCASCHTGTTYFDGAVKPTGHIPTNSSCSTCHVVAGDFTISGLGTNAQLHTGITSGCRTCHAAGPFAGSGPTSSTLCTTAALPYQPIPMPLSACGASATVSSAATHIPVGTASCELCHGSTSFTNFKMSSTTAMRPGTTTGPVPGTTMHTVGVPNPPNTCMSCHEYRYTWFGVNIRTRDSASHHAGQDCNGSGCHRNTSSSFASLIRPVPVRRAAVNAALPRLLPRDLPGVAEANAAAGAPFDHRGVAVGQCQSCHNGQLARGRPARHMGNRLSCDSCHRTTAWAPAQFTHAAGAAGQCLACHNGVDASAKPGQHFVTARSCDSCHQMLAWVPVRYQHLSPAYQPAPDRSTCISCHLTNGEIIPRQARGGARPRPVPAPSKP